MSLIQEALKRKLEEKGGAGQAATPPPAPASLQNAPSRPVAPAQSGVTVLQPEPSRGNGIKIAGMIVGIAVMVLAAGVLIALALKSWSGKEGASAQPGQTSIPAGTVSVSGRPAPAPVAAPAGPSDEATLAANPLASVQDRVSSMKAKVLDSRREGSGITGDNPPPLTAAPARPAPVAATTTHAPAPASTPTASAGAVIQSQEFSLWPRVTVNGILAKGTRGKGIAIINNQMVSVNDSIEGVKVVEVRGQGVTMEFGGETRFVEIGQTIQ